MLHWAEQIRVLPTDPEIRTLHWPTLRSSGGTERIRVQYSPSARNENLRIE